MLKSKTCCFIGHRPKSLPWGDDEHASDCCALKDKLYAEIEGALHNGYHHFIVGMAQGVGIYTAETLLFCKRIYPFLTIEAAIPCTNQIEGWTADEKERYAGILARFDQQTVLSERDTPTCMQERNRYMVEQSTRLVAVWNGKPGETGDTVQYAMKKGISVVMLPVR